MVARQRLVTKVRDSTPAAGRSPDRTIALPSRAMEASIPTEQGPRRSIPPEALQSTDRFASLLPPVGAVLAVVAAALAPSIAAAEVYRCSVNGEFVYQQVPCAPDLPVVRPVPMKPSAVAANPVTVPVPDERRRQAELMREKNAREREAIQRGFTTQAPKRPGDLPDPILAVGTQLTQEQVCKAAIATIMGRDPGIVRGYYEEGGVTYLAYQRPDDGKLWKYKCRLDGRTVLWGMADGRWRNHSLDGTVSFERAAQSLVIRQQHSDGSGNSRSFSLGAL